MFTRSRAQLLVLAVFAVAAIWTQLQATEYTAEQLVEKWVEAIGGRQAVDAIDAIYTRSRVSTSGLEGTVEQWATSEGKIREDLDFGGLFGSLTVFDGDAGWVLDHNAKLRPIQGVEFEGQITSAYLSSLSHLVPGRREGTLKARGVDDSGKHYVLDVTPAGGRIVTFYLDRQTFLPVRREQADDDRTETTYFNDWRDVSGVKLAHAFRVSTGEAKYDVLIAVEEVQLNPVLPENAFAEPEEGPKDYRLASPEGALDIPFELNSNHIYMQAKLNGVGPLWFIFDTGAGVTVLDKGTAEALGLEMQGSIEGRGAGEGSTDVSVIADASFELPGVELLHQTVMAIPLDMVEPYEGRAIDGILGYDLISRFVVEIDYEGRRMHLYEPDNYTYSGAGTRVPLVMEANHPHVVAEIAMPDSKPVKASLTIDTGARTALHLSSPFCVEHNMPGAAPTISGGFGAGVGGETKQDIGRVATLRLGDIELAEVITGFSKDQQGALASTDYAGLIGGDVLRRFTVTFDYSRTEMILEPNGAYSAPFEYDMCGAFLRSPDPGFERVEIHRLIEGSPAVDAGLQQGDFLLSVDGTPVTGGSLETVRQMFLTADREYRLTIQRGEKKIETTLKTRRLI